MKISSAQHPRGWYPQAGWYLRNVKAARAQLAQTGTVTVAWPGAFPRALDAAGFTRWLQEGLDRRINAKGGIEPTGRKTTDDYHWRMVRDCRAVREHVTRRLRVTQFETAECRRRFSHYLSDPRED